VNLYFSGEKLGKSTTISRLFGQFYERRTHDKARECESLDLYFETKKHGNTMASIKERKDKEGRTHYHVQVRIKGHPPQYASFKRKTDAERWIQNTESAIREGRHFKTTQAKKHTLGELIDRYIQSVLPNKKKSEQKQTAQLTW